MGSGGEKQRSCALSGQKEFSDSTLQELWNEKRAQEFASGLTAEMELGRGWRLRWRVSSKDAGKVLEAEEGR